MMTKEDVNQITTAIRAELKPIKQDIKKIRQDQNSIIKFFDEAYLDLRERVEKLEKIVGVFPTQ